MKTKKINYQHLYDYLVEVLTTEVSLYEKLAVVLKQKQEAIIAGEVEKLKNYVHDEQTLVQEATSVVDTRKAHVSTLNQILNISEQEVRLKTLIDKFPPDYSLKLTNLRHHLKTNLNLITRINRENKYLLNSSIEYVKGMVHLFLKAGDESTELYGVDGIMTAHEEVNKVLDCQI